MSITWKNNLKDFLKDGNEKNLKVSLRQNWVDIYPEDKKIIYQFLYHTKLTKLFNYLLAIDLQNQMSDLPWLLFIQTLFDHQQTIPPKQFEELNTLLKKQDALNASVNNPSELITQIKVKKRHTLLQNVKNTKQELLASANIAKSERLMEKYVHFMNELKKYSPNEYNVTSIISEQEKNKAEGILQRRRRKNNKLETHTQFTNDEKHLLNIIKEQSFKFLRKNKAKASDFAYLLRSMGEKESAIDFIQSENDSDQKDWQLLDYLLYSKQFLSLLEHCSTLKNKHAQNPDALFSIYYNEAVAYWELGEKERAIDLMSQISSMRPNYKSSIEILSQWKEELFE